MIIQLNDISKNFDRNYVLNNIDFEINRGEIAGIIGPNGSGKTTLLNIIMGLVKQNSGTIFYSDKNQINAAVSRKGFFGDMTVEKNLLLYANLNNQSSLEVNRVLNLFEIDFRNKKFSELSAGMKQRVSLAKVFMGDYNLVLLDEPTNHLDIDSIMNLRSAIQVRQNSGTAFLIASHILTELERLCDYILFIREGKIVKRHSMNEISTDYLSLEDAYLKISEQ